MSSASDQRRGRVFVALAAIAWSTAGLLQRELALGTLVGERVSGPTWLAMGIALAGAAVMVGGPGRPGAVGGVLSFVCALSFAMMLVITRVRRDVSMAPATCLSQLIVLLCAAPF